MGHTETVAELPLYKLLPQCPEGRQLLQQPSCSSYHQHAHAYMTRYMSAALRTVEGREYTVC